MGPHIGGLKVGNKISYGVILRQQYLLSFWFLLSKILHMWAAENLAFSADIFLGFMLPYITS